MLMIRISIPRSSGRERRSGLPGTTSCVYDSAWEAHEAFEFDRNPEVAAWAKNDHLGFEILYVYRGVVRKYRPDYLIRMATGRMVVLEVKGQDDEQNQTKRSFLDQWVKAVNGHGGFGSWSWDVSRNPGDIKDILAKHSG
jgi:type III restriction enzyme